MTTALEGGEGSASRPGRSLPPEKTRYPLYSRLGGIHRRFGQKRKILPPTGIRSSDRPARSQSLYRLCYPAHIFLTYFSHICFFLLYFALSSIVMLYRSCMQQQFTFKTPVFCAHYVSVRRRTIKSSYFPGQH